MMQVKDYLLLLIVTFMTVAIILPAASVMSGIDRNYLLVGLLIVVAIALAHYSRFALVSVVVIATIGANLPPEIAGLFNIDPRILIGTLVAVLLVPAVNLIFKLPTGLDKPQGIPANKSTAGHNSNIVELNLPDPTNNLTDSTTPV